MELEPVVIQNAKTPTVFFEERKISQKGKVFGKPDLMSKIFFFFSKFKALLAKPF